jgi:hypothetical protein
MKDIGELIGKYFFVLACINIITILVGFYQSGNLLIELGGIIFLIWGGKSLIQKNPKSRKWAILISGLLLIASLITCIITFYWDIPTGIRIWGFEITENTDKSTVYLLSLFTFVLFFIPFYFLRTEKAIKEFDGELLTDGEEKQVWEEFQGKVEEDEDGTA